MLANIDRSLTQHTRDDERMQDDLHRDIGHVHDLLPTLLPRLDYEARHAQLSDQIAINTSRLDRLEGNRSGETDTIARIISAVAVLASIGTLVAVILLHG
jgi:hypothetical protein